MNNGDNCNTKLNASPGGSRDLSLSMVCNVSWSPSTSVKHENDAGRTKVKRKVRNVVGRVICVYLLRCERSNIILEVPLWENGTCRGFSDIA